MRKKQIPIHEVSSAINAIKRYGNSEDRVALSAALASGRLVCRENTVKLALEVLGRENVANYGTHARFYENTY
jgi:hypothetical protein